MVTARAVLIPLLLTAAGCSGNAPDPGVGALEDLFRREAPVHVSDSVVWALTARVTEEEAEMLGPRVGYVPLSMLRGQSGDPGPASADGYAITTVSGEHLADGLSPVPRIVLETPYWTSIFRRLGARGRTGAYVATNLLYAIHRYGGDGPPLDSLWTPPPSWKQARRPTQGEFLPGNQQAWWDYLGEITVIRSLAAVADSVLVVSVGPYEEGSPSSTVDPGELLEVYVGRRMVGVDLPAPGELVAYSPSSLFFLSRSADSGGATLIEYVWREG